MLLRLDSSKGYRPVRHGPMAQPGCFDGRPHFSPTRSFFLYS
jgi:hypothetical protein